MSEREAVGAWWQSLGEDDRQRLLAMSAQAYLPSDFAVPLQLAGVTVIAVGTRKVGEHYEGLYEQPHVLRDLLDELLRQQRD
ncbi:hypothetical protein [Kineococcus sp. G2]|uniref:hypothetical protein n=1 Tax=Kineococcus sp. G2 TaxID=3127484 RepID=UPI00301E583A